MKRVLKWLGVLVLLVAAAIGAVIYSAFAHNKAIVDGQEVAPGVRTVKDGFVSVFVLDAGPGKVALVDCGNDKEGKAILGELGRRGLGGSAVAAIFLTHGHSDHTAGCHLFPDATVYALSAETARIGAAARVTPVADGQTVQVGELAVQTFAAPGHTAGSAVFLARGVLFFGDSAGASKDGKVMRAVRLFSSDPAENVASLKALAARLAPRAGEIHALAFAHSGPLDGFAPLAAFSAE